MNGHAVVPDIFANRVSRPQAAGGQPLKQRWNGPVSATAGDGLAARVHRFVDKAVLQELAVEGGDEDARIIHRDEILHGNYSRHPELHHFRRDAGKGRLRSR